MTQAGTTLYLLVVSAAIFVCCMAILTSTIRLAFGMARDDQPAVLGDDGEGQPPAAHADRDLHHRGRSGGGAVHPVRGGGRYRESERRRRST